MSGTLVSRVGQKAGWAAMGFLLLVAPSMARAAENDAPADDDFMRPTELGARLTPNLVRIAARNWVLDLAGVQLAGTHEDDGLDLSDDQRAKLVDAVNRRFLELWRRQGQQGQQFIEALIEGALGGQAKVFTPESARDLARRIKPMTPALREFLKGLAEDSRPVLSDEQFARLQTRLGRQEAMLERLDERVERWERGEVKADEKPLDDLVPPKEEEKEKKLTQQERQQRERLRHAERMARWEMNALEPLQWDQYLESAVLFFKFDEQQRAEAERILSAYRQRAEAIMTDDWKEKLRKNRLRYHLRFQLTDLLGGPWEYQVQREFKEMVQPLEEMGLAFRRELFALVTDEQREAGLAKIREALAKHGMTVGPQDMEVLGLIKP